MPGQEPSPRESRRQELAAELERAGITHAARISWLDDGGLGTIEARPGGGKKSEFVSSDPAAVLRRTEEIMRFLKPWLGELELSEPLVQPGPRTAQVFYRQSVGGIPLFPPRTVTVLLGPGGELLRMDNGSAREEVSLQAGEAAAGAGPGVGVEEARGIVRSASGAASVEGGALVAWWTGEPPGRKAYEFTTRGARWVVDAGSGKILLREDRRIYIRSGTEIPSIPKSSSISS
jgi:hypothetical protein